MGALIGVDPHKATNVVAAIDEQGEVIGQETFPATRKGLRALERWATRFPSKAHFASYAGVAPIEASSGEVVRQALARRQPRPQPGHAHDRRLPGSQRSARQGVSSEEAGGGKVASGGDALPQAAHLGCGFQCAGRGFAARFANGLLTQRGLERLSNNC
jgi:Transposase IS116/IS110/IS902 family